jgi:hypothetical protein
MGTGQMLLVVEDDEIVRQGLVPCLEGLLSALAR